MRRSDCIVLGRFQNRKVGPCDSSNANAMILRCLSCRAGASAARCARWGTCRRDVHSLSRTASAWHAAAHSELDDQSCSSRTLATRAHSGQVLRNNQTDKLSPSPPPPPSFTLVHLTVQPA